MTKFEEEAMNEFAKSEYVYTAYDGTFRGETEGTVMEFAKGTTTYTFPWLEFAKNWHSNEEYQELLKENNKLKSQLQQQSLPVVPECVAEWYEGCAPIPVETCITDFLFNYQKEKSVDDGTEFEQWFIRTDNSIEILMDMKRLGYEVEKPQLFYLKNKLTTSYLILDTSTGYFEHWGSTEATGRYKSEFTQQEIESMQTGSYELVPVEDGK